MGRSRRDNSTLELQALASAMVHELRTALSGEVELALLRDRTPAEYRDALSQIAERVTELLALTSDLAFLGYPSKSDAVPATARLDTILAELSERYSATPDVTVTTESGGLLRLRTVGHIVRGCGGSVELSSVDGSGAVHAKLIRA